jgi:homoserine O-acetyltransferase
MFGIPGDPRVAQVWRARTIPDDPRKHAEVRGVIAYARFAPDNRTTQLYINTVDRPQEVEPFAPFGTVIEGMAVVDSLYSGYGNRSGGSYRGGQQDSLFLQGNAYLDRAFPLLDRIIRVVIEQVVRS